MGLPHEFRARAPFLACFTVRPFLHRPLAPSHLPRDSSHPMSDHLHDFLGDPASAFCRCWRDLTPPHEFRARAPFLASAQSPCRPFIPRPLKNSHQLAHRSRPTLPPGRPAQPPFSPPHPGPLRWAENGLRMGNSRTCEYPRGFFFLLFSCVPIRLPLHSHFSFLVSAPLVFWYGSQLYFISTCTYN